MPYKGKWKEVLNTNAGEYGGTGVGNFGEVFTQDQPFHDQPVSVELTIPGLTSLWFKWEGEA